VRIAEVDGHLSGEAEFAMPSHLLALVPRQRAPQLGRQRAQRCDQGVADVGRGLALGQVQQRDIPAGAFDEGSDRCIPAGSHDQIAFPVAGHGAVGRFGGTFTDQHHVGEPSAGQCSGAARSPPGAAGAQGAVQFAA